MLVAGMISLCVLASVDTVLRAERGQPYRGMSLAASALAGLAVLAKGLIGLVLPGAILLIWFAWRRRWRGLAALLWLPALLVFAVVAVPWFVLMQLRFPGFYDYFFVYQHFQRFAASGFNNAQPFWFYLPVVAGLSLPWSLWAGGIMRRTFWQEGHVLQAGRLCAARAGAAGVPVGRSDSWRVARTRRPGIAAAGAHERGCRRRHLRGGGGSGGQQRAGQRRADGRGGPGAGGTCRHVRRPAYLSVRPGAVRPRPASHVGRGRLAGSGGAGARQLAQGTL
ncbi:hypothetical protein G6F22_015949 [Rhizopus arrhizus]|nr:hypothetical protein G6F22_015949 [Rhizopus arrhizus]